MHYSLPRKFNILVFLSVIFTLCFSAGSVQAADGARAYVEHLSNDVLAVIRSKSSDKDKESKLRAIFEQSVDTDWMGRFVMGQHFRKLSADKKTSYLGLYKDYLIQSYIPRFKEYTGEELKISGVRNEKGEEFFVQTEIVHPNGQPSTLVDYRLRKEGDGFKIIDIIGEGISLITTQRSDFGGIISQQGVDSFLEKLQAKVKATKN